MAEPTITQALAEATLNTNRLWVVCTAALVFFMQAGFMCLECGMVREKNVVVVAMKNVIDWVIGTMGFFLVGFGLMFGHDNGYGLFGTDLFMLEGIRTLTDGNPLGDAFFMFQLAFAGTAATIVSGATSERCGFMAYILISLFVSIVIYPVFGYWAWGGGFFATNKPWLASMGYLDFAGSSVVHMVGALVSLVAIKMMGPRLGRYDEQGNIIAMEPYNYALSALGVFILWFGWWGFNGGSTLAVNDQIGPIILHTNLAAAVAGATAYFHSFYVQKKADLAEKFMGGILCGLVAITACCSVVTPIGAVFVGLTSGLLHNYAFDLLAKKFRLDDPVGALPVHGVGGVWGILCVGIFGQPALLPLHNQIQQLGVQALGVLACIVWVVPSTYVALALIRKYVGLRASPAEERAGLNMEGEVIEKHSELPAGLNAEMLRKLMEG